MNVSGWMVAPTIFITTFVTEKWIRQVFSAMCELDLERGLQIGGVWLKAAGSTVDISKGSERFTMNESEFVGRIAVSTPSEVPWAWRRVYTTSKCLKEVEWIRTLKTLHKHLQAADFYAHRQRENTQKSRMGPTYGKSSPSPSKTSIPSPKLTK